jgi:hypothetical protein
MSHPLSYNCPPEIKDLCTNPGNVCAFLASGDNALRINSLVSDDCMVVTLGMLTCNGTCAARLFMDGAVADKKLCVLPESSIDVPFIVIVYVVGVQSKDKVN